MKIANNPDTGEYLGFQGGEWKPLRMAKNNAGDILYLGDNGWEPLPVMPGTNTERHTTSAGSEYSKNPNTDGGSLLDSTKRAAELTGRGLVQALGDFTAPVSIPMNFVNGLFGGDPNYWGNGEQAADKFGLPRPKTTGESLLTGAVQGVGDAASMLAGGAALKGAANAETMLSQAGKILRDNPTMNLATGATSGAATQAARDNGAGGFGQFAAGIGGAFVPLSVAGAMNSAMRGARSMYRVGEALSPAGQQRIAAQNLRMMASNPDQLLKKINTNNTILVPDSPPTLGQIAQDAGLAGMEKGRASGTSPMRADYQQRYSNQKAARQAEVDAIFPGVEGRFAAQQMAPVTALENGISENTLYSGDRAPELGAKLQEIYNQNYQASKQQVRKAYSAIDPENSTAFVLEPLYKSFADIVPSGRFAPKLPAEISAIMKDMRGAIHNGETVSYRDLQNMRTTLTDIAASAKSAGDANLHRISTGMKSRLDSYLDSQAPQENAMAKPGSPNYKQAMSAAANDVANDPWNNDLQLMYEQGINRDWLAREYGEESTRNLSAKYPGLVRKNGRFIPDEDLGDLTIRHEDSDALYNQLVDRLPSRKNAKQQRMAALADNLANGAGQHTGFTPEQVDRFQQAKDFRRQQGQKFEENFNLSLSRGNLRPDQIPSNYFKSGPAGSAAADDFWRSMGTKPEAKTLLQDYVLQRLQDTAGRNGSLDYARLEKFLSDNRDALSRYPEIAASLDPVRQEAFTASRQANAMKIFDKKNKYGQYQIPARTITPDLEEELLDSGLFTQNELDRIKNVQADAARQRKMDELSAVRGSPTAQNLATQAIMDTFLGRSLGRVRQPGIIRTGGLANAANSFVGGLLNRGTEWLYGKADQNINNLIDSAFLNPDFARQLLEMHSKGYIPDETFRNLFGRYGRTLRNQAIRSGVQSNNGDVRSNPGLLGLLDLPLQEKQ